MGKTRDLFKKIRDTKGTFHAKMGTIKDRKGFPRSSVGKESPCNAGDPSLIPGLRRSAGEGIGYLLQYFWSTGKESACNAGDLGWEDPLEKGKATRSSILAWGIPWTV